MIVKGALKREVISKGALRGQQGSSMGGEGMISKGGLLTCNDDTPVVAHKVSYQIPSIYSGGDRLDDIDIYQHTQTHTHMNTTCNSYSCVKMQVDFEVYKLFWSIAYDFEELWINSFYVLTTMYPFDVHTHLNMFH